MVAHLFYRYKSYNLSLWFTSYFLSYIFNGSIDLAVEGLSFDYRVPSTRLVHSFILLSELSSVFFLFRFKSFRLSCGGCYTF